MRFTLIDRIVELEPGVRIEAVKALSLSEEYLKDHFPLFPVMPGVLMLEAMYQASAWLVRKTDDFAHALVQLKEARNIKFADFVEPGEVLVVTAEIQKRDAGLTWLKAQGVVDESVAVSAHLTLESCILGDEDTIRLGQDMDTLASLRKEFDILFYPRQPLVESS